MFDTHYLRQVEMLLACLPSLCLQQDFAITGGTAINFIAQNMPRLSVDIDLTYLPILGREASVNNIEEDLQNLAAAIQKQNPHFTVKPRRSNETAKIFKLYVYYQNTMIKIETNLVKRGTLYPVEQGRLCEQINLLFKQGLTNIPVLSTSELYAGKLCASLSRQHPRDLFDVKYLINSIGLTDDIRQAFVVYLACDVRPIHELLAPRFKDIRKPYMREFRRMATEDISPEELIEAGKSIVKQLQNDLTTKERAFLLSVKRGEPDYSLLPFNNLETMPGLKWKILNIRRMDKQKHVAMLDKLRRVLRL